MRPIELASASLIAICLAFEILGGLSAPLITVISILLILSLLSHFVREKPRWQMIPLYLLGIAICFYAWLMQLIFVSAWLALPTLLLFLLAVALPILLPVPVVAKPRGPFAVGTMTFSLEDNTRREIYSSDPSELRRIQIQIWYPAAPHRTDRRAPWMPEAKVYAPALSKYLRLPAFFLDHLNLVSTPAFLNAPIAEVTAQGDGYPVIIFSHGWNGFRAQSTGQMLELASHGYVVVGMQHTYGALITVFPDGKIAANNPAALPVGAPDPVYDLAARKLVNQWAEDLSFVLDYMGKVSRDRSSPFYGAVDFSRVGMFGHSTGGGATIEFCGRDLRCKAGLTEDAFMTPVSEEVLKRGLRQPFFFMFSPTFPDEKNIRLFEQLHSHLVNTSRVVTILGTAHQDFTDLPILTPLARRLGLKGPINGRRVTRIVEDYVLAFFDLNLKGQPSTLFDGPSRLYPEVKFSD
jgi:Platelet-activating factor acetylhydrolase, isoform II